MKEAEIWEFVFKQKKRVGQNPLNKNKAVGLHKKCRLTAFYYFQKGHPLIKFKLPHKNSKKECPYV